MTVDLTGIAVSVIGGVFTIIGIVFPVWLQAHMKDQAAAVTVANAVKNSLGAMQQAATRAVTVMNPQARIPGLSNQMQVGLQYALDHAGDEAARLGITPAALADKINAQVGLTEIASNVASASSPAQTIAPLAAGTPPTPIVVTSTSVPVTAALGPIAQ